MTINELKALIQQYIKTNGNEAITGQILQTVLLAMVDEYPDISGLLPKSGGTITGDLTVNQHLSVYDMNVHELTATAVLAAAFVVNGGTSSQFLKADGSLDNNTYVTRSPSYLDFEQGSSQLEDGTIYNDTVISVNQIYTEDMVLPAGRWTYAFNLIGEEGVWYGDGTTQINVRNRDTGDPIDKVSEGYDAEDTYQGASRYWVSFYLPQMTAVRIELDDPAGATLTMYKPCLNMGYNRMKIA